jgi:hypothetical protein
MPAKTETGLGIDRGVPERSVVSHSRARDF